MKWMEKAACIGRTDEFVVPTNDGIYGRQSIPENFLANAVAICDGCPVIEECRTYSFTKVPIND